MEKIIENLPEENWIFFKKLISKRIVNGWCSTHSHAILLRLWMYIYTYMYMIQCVRMDKKDVILQWQVELFPPGPANTGTQSQRTLTIDKMVEQIFTTILCVKFKFNLNWNVPKRTFSRSHVWSKTYENYLLHTIFSI